MARIGVRSSPIPGDPERVRRISAQYASVAARAEEILSRLRAIETGIGPQMWRGDAADSFTALLAATGPDLATLATSYGTASHALDIYAAELAAAQDTARAARAEAATATEAHDRATADRDTARSEADRHAADAADAHARMDLAAAQTAEQRRADALRRENTANAAIDQAQQTLRAAEHKADDALTRRDAAAARCIRELDAATRTAISTRNLAHAPAGPSGPPPAEAANHFSSSDIGHAILDVAGLVPLIGEAADGINAAWYTAEGDYSNAALSAAAMIPGIGMAAAGARMAARGSDIARSVDNAPRPQTPPAPHGGRLEGQSEIMVNDPTVTGRTITDIDRVEGGVLWEEKSATTAQNIDNWVRKHIDRKFRSYLEARQHLEGYENSPIGFRFTKPGATPDFKAAVQKALDDLRTANPDVDIRLDWGE
jgi:uncharacterized protein YukE